MGSPAGAAARSGQRAARSGSRRPYLQRVLGADGDDVVLVVAQLAAPAAPLADPLDEARLVRALDRAVAAARAQQLPLQGERRRVVSQ